MQYAAMPPARRPNHVVRWFLAIVALFEIAVLAALVLFARGAAPCLAARSLFGGSDAASAIGAGPSIAEPAAASLPSADGDATAAPASPSAAESGAADSADSAATTSSDDAAAAPAPASSGSLNDVVDPNCVAKTAASLLTSQTPGPEPTTTCGPMKAPAELKAAAKQMQQLTGSQSK